MRALIDKEWRENRALVIGFLILAPILSIAFKWGVTGWKETVAFHSVMFIVPGLSLLFVLAIAADLVSGEAASGRIGLLAALPVRPEKLWLAKTGFLFGSAALYLAYLLIVETAILTAAGKDFAWIYMDVGARLPGVLAIVLVGSATLFYSTLMDRGLAAGFAALLTLAGFGLLVSAFDPPRYGIAWDKQGLAILPFAETILIAGFLAGSFVAFTRGRIHLGARLRRVALAAAALLLIAVPPTAHAAASLVSWSRIAPDDTEAVYDLGHLSPDGWLFATARRPAEGPFGAKSPATRPLFAVRLTDGVVRDLTEHGRLHVTDKTFANPGRVLLTRWDPIPGSEARNHIVVDYDLEAGEPKTTRPVMGLELGSPSVYRVGPHLVMPEPAQARGYRVLKVLREGREPLPLPKGWQPFTSHCEWGFTILKHEWRRDENNGWRSRSGFAVLDVETGERIDLPAHPYLLPPDRTGRALLNLDGELVWHSLADGVQEKVGVGSHRSILSSPDGRFALVVTDDLGVHLISAAGGAPRKLGASPGAPRKALWSPDSKSFLILSIEGGVMGRVDRPGLEPFAHSEKSRPSPAHLLAKFDGRRAIFVAGRGWLEPNSIEVVTPDGAVRRLLPTK